MVRRRAPRVAGFRVFTIVSWVGAVALACAVEHGLASDAPAPPKDDLKTVRSAEGGFSVGVPADWYVKEFPKDASYQAFLSREKVERDDDNVRFGMTFVRLHDYRTMFTFKATQPADIYTEYANRIASLVAQGGMSTMIAMKSPVQGIDSQMFSMAAGEGNHCRGMLLIVGLREHEWFHALWVVPCSEAKEARTMDLVNRMVGTLSVETEWGTKGVSAPPNGDASSSGRP